MARGIRAFARSSVLLNGSYELATRQSLSTAMSSSPTCVGAPVHNASQLGCATTYDFTSWGSRLEPIVRFIKQRGPDAVSTIYDLYQYLQL